jgi:hypothetical protein
MKHVVSFVVLAAVTLSAFLVSPSSAADLAINPNTVFFSSNAKYTHGTAGASIAIGDLVYLDVTDNKWKLADANLSLAASKVQGVASTAAVSGQRVYICYEDPGFNCGQFTGGGTVFVLSTNPGKIAPSADIVSGMYVSVVGVGTTNSGATMNFKITRCDTLKP